MAALLSRRVRTILIVLLAVAATSCTKPLKENDGGQHTGGGFVAYSTADQVRTALALAIQLASEPLPAKNIYVQFWNSWGRFSKFEFIKDPRRIFPNIGGPVDGPVDLERNASVFASPTLSALASKKLKLLESGNCLNSAVGMHNDASVSSFTVAAEICFSIGNLTRIPPSSLLREVLSLLLHEVSHMGGANEAEAVQWQGSFSDYFGMRFGDIETDSVSTSTLLILSEAKTTLARATVIAQANVNDPMVLTLMGSLADQLSSLPYYRDALALQLKTNALKPGLIGNYSYSVVALMQKISVRFQTKPDVLNVRGIGVHLNFAPDDDVPSSLQEFAADLAQIEENFSAFLGGSPTARSACVQPDGSGDLNDFPVDPPGSGRHHSMHVKCDPIF